MSSPWKSDSELFDGAGTVAQKFAELMVAKNPFEPDEAYGWLSANLHKFQGNAEYFMTLDPAKITDELERMQAVGRQVGHDRSERVNGGMQEARGHLSDWLGDAAVAFRQQLSNIEAFTNVHSEFVARAVGGLAASLALAAHVRRDYLELTRATVEAIDNAIAEIDKKSTEFLVKIGGGLAKTVIGTLADPAKALSTVAQGAIDIAVEGIAYSINGVEFDDVLRSFAEQEGRLRAAYDEELEYIAFSLKQDEDGLADQEFLMDEPMPSCTDIYSPDFSYGRFHTEGRPSDDQFNQRVEDERKKMIAEENSSPRSGNGIQDRLSGEEDHT